MSISAQLTTFQASVYNASPTLLPENIASFVTAIALAARLSLRCSSLLIEALLESVKYSTSFSFGVSRQALINALSTAKRLHQLTLPADSSSSEDIDSEKAAEESVGVIDGIFGSNESSRAIASIITLVHRELISDPNFELAKIGKVAMLSGLTKAMTAFAILQNITHKRTLKQMKITVLWKGLVVEEEDNEQSLICYDNTKQVENNGNAVSSNSAEGSDHQTDIINELEEILATSSTSIDENNSSTVDLSQSDMEDLKINQFGEPYNLYEIQTTVQRMTTTTTRIRPIDLNSVEQPRFKEVVQRTREEDQEAFMAVVDHDGRGSYQPVSENTIPGAWPNSTSKPSKSNFKILLSSVSKKLSRKKVERQTNYGYIATDEDDHMVEDVIEGPITTVTSTSTTLRSSSKFSTSNDQENQSKPLPSVPSVQEEDELESSSFSDLETKSKRRKSWSGLRMKQITRKKSVTNLLQKGADALMSSKKRKPPHDTPPPVPSLNSNNVSKSSKGYSGDNSPYIHKSTSVNSLTSLSSVARTLTTTTYTTSQMGPNSSSRSLIRSPSVPARLNKKKPASPLDMEPNPQNFPRKHIITNIAHFMRYASAAYGESFMRILGIGDIPNVLPYSHHHHPNHHAFAHHTGVSVEDILLSSYTDSSILSSVVNPKLHALVHYVTVDHYSEAIVLTCRGTLGLSDVLTDLTCEYKEFVLPTDDLYNQQNSNNTIPPRRYTAHGGMLEAAQLLAVQKGKVFQAIQKGLEKYPNYGLVLCGHSLGAGVASLLSVLWSEERLHYLARKSNSKNPQQLISQLSSAAIKRESSAFVTSEISGLPAGRPIHCFTYGSPCTMSLPLSEYCGQGLVTSVVHAFDIVTCLSLGLLKDFKNVALSLHEDSGVTDEILSRVIGHYQKKKANNSKDSAPGPSDYHVEEEENDQWFWALIKTMRAGMDSEKLYPPSKIYMIESVPQLVQHTESEVHTSRGGARAFKHKRAHMVQLSLCEDVESRFSEIVFSRTMFMDHSSLLFSNKKK
ncbi:hypothetical protein K501DRAFT_297757 [Backusella circina FSU 941]|nr:hypothetical protein K501DRAFT_297757 [Backusella circina FSU 941]